MHHKRIIAAVTAVLACSFALLSTAGALATSSGTKVSVRIEGLNRTLLETHSVVVPSNGQITAHGAPIGDTCPANSVLGALNVATKGNWSASYYKGLGYDITKIDGVTENYTTAHPAYWEIFVGHTASSEGACSLKPHSGEQIVFAAVPEVGSAGLLGLSAPSHVTAGHWFDVKVVYYNAKGVAVPLSGATVAGRGGGVTTDSSGIARLRVIHSGTVSLVASDKGYVRSAAVTVHSS
jgi:hypothetical protein